MKAIKKWILAAYAATITDCPKILHLDFADLLAAVDYCRSKLHLPSPAFLCQFNQTKKIIIFTLKANKRANNLFNKLAINNSSYKWSKKY